MESQANLGRYRLVAEIARGGMGIVYLAHLRGPGGFQKMVVVKELKPELAEEASFREMFLEEANLAARLNHRNIVQTNEVGSEGARLFMAMDYLEGKSLHSVQKRLSRGKRLSFAMEARLLAEVCAGLHYAHELKDYDGSPLEVVHRDVGPQNVFITFDGQVKLLDFGVAKRSNREQETRAGVLKGRVAYMSPEQAGGERVDRRTDVFALGVMLRETITGKRLWADVNEIGTLKRLLARDLPPFPEEPRVPAELRAICERAMAPKRDDRFATADEMRVALERFAQSAEPTSSLGELGAIVARAFEEERTKLRDLIDGHLAAGENDGPIPTIDAAGVPELGTPSHPMLTASVSRSRPSSKASSAGALASSVPREPPPERPVPPAPMSRRRSAGVAGVAALVVLGIGALLVRGGPKEEPASRGASAPSASSAPVAVAVAPPAQGEARPSEGSENVEIVVRATPANAQIFVDEARVDGNPFHAKFPRGKAMHAVRAVAPGYLPKTELVSFDANASVAISLERAPAYGAAPARPADTKASAAVPPAVAAVPLPASPAKTTDINPAGGKAPKREVDPRNPYGVE